MAASEPARKLDDQVYDKGDEQPVTRPDLQAIEGGGKKSPPTGKLSSVGDDEKSPKELDEAENEPNLDNDRQLGRGYTGSPKDSEKLSTMKPSVRGVVGFAKTNRGKVVLGGAAAGFVTLIIIGFFALLPFKILHIVNNLQSHFFSSSENAVQKETDVLFSSYIRNYVLPGITSCRGGTIDKTCTSTKSIAGNGLVSQLYKGWRTAKLENTLAGKYGMEFKSVNGHFFMKMPGMTGNGANIDSFLHPANGQTVYLDEFMAKSTDPQFKRVGRAELRQTYRDALAKETKWKQVMYRYKVGGLLSRKYGLKRCIIACTTRDNFADWKDYKTRSAKMIVAERVLKPRSETLALAIECIINGGCDPMDKSATDSDGRKISKTQAKLQQNLESLMASETGKYASVLANSNDILKNGYKRFIMGKIVSKLGGDGTKLVTDKVADKAIPVIGWINGATGIVQQLENAGKGIKAWSYMTNATAMVSLYATYRVYADETKTGNIDPAIVGSFTDALGAGDKGDKGGTAGAEQTPAYNYFMNGSSSSSSTSAFNNLLGGNAYAASNSSQYLCDDGKPIPAGKLVCPEEVLGGNNNISDFINGTLAGLGPIKGLSDWWNGTIGWLIRPIINGGSYVGNLLLENAPGYSQLMGWLSSAVGPIINYLANELIPSPFGAVRGSASSDSQSSTTTSFINNLVGNPVYAASTDSTGEYMSGGRTFDLMAGGADVSGNDYAQNGLGGKKLTDQQATAILNEQTQQDLQSYKNESFLARMFDTNSTYSPVTKLAAAMPNSLNSVGQSVASIFSNPLGKIKGVFASLFSFNHAFAASTAQPDPFGVTQYGYVSNDPTLAAANQDPEAYWDANCTSDGTTLDWSKPVNANWQDSAIPNPDTGMPENDTTDPCLLIQTGVGSAGATSPNGSSLLTADDLAGGSSGSSSGGDVSGSGPIETGSNAQLAQKILDYQKTGQYHCDNSGDCTDLQKVVKGQSLAGSDGCKAQTLDPRVLKLILYVIEVGKFNIGTFALCGDHHDDGPNGHSGGFAVDFSSVNGVAVVAANAKPTTLKLAQFLNSISGELRPRQLITAGYGNKYDDDLLALEIPDSAFYGGKGGDNADHRNHIHTGY